MAERDMEDVAYIVGVVLGCATVYVAGMCAYVAWAAGML